MGYGYLHGKKGYRVRIDGTNSVVTTRDVSFCAFESKPVEVQLLPNDPARTPDAVVTEPANADDVAARLNTPVGTDNTATATDEDAENAAIEREVSAVITEQPQPKWRWLKKMGYPRGYTKNAAIFCVERSGRKQNCAPLHHS